ncbi:MAG: endo-1,4-beta-xylanase [Pseudomonadota bacterium]
MRGKFLALAVLFPAACDQGAIAEPDAVWTGSIGHLVVDGGDPERFELVRLDGAGAAHGDMSLAPVENAAIDRAIRLKTLGQPPRMESLQARLVTTGDIDAGEACWLRFEARAVEPQIELGLGRLSISIRPSTSNAAPLLQRSIYLEPAWTPIDIAFEAPADADAGEAEIVFGFGTQLQMLDISGVSMRCFDQDHALTRLPSTSFSYAGREPEAAWRATTESQIERYRKGDLTVEVTDASGQPIADAEIHIQMSRHAFEFGATIDADQLVGGQPDDNEGMTVAYRKNLKEMFNTAALDQVLDWTAWTDGSRRPATENALAWIESLGLGLRGRGLVPTEGEKLPTTLQEKRDDPEAIRDAVRAGITVAAGDLDGRVSAWDVVDRPREHHDLLDLLGWDELATWFQIVRDVAPEAGLALNESDILAGDRMAELATLLGKFISESVPIDRIGVQGAFGAQPPPIQVLSDRLDQLASFGLPLVITAFDMETVDQDLRLDFMRDFLMLAFSHPSVEGFMFRQFWEIDDDSSGVAMFRQDGAITPFGKTYRDLVLGRWWTDIVALSNADGALTSRVFQGDYMISARKDDQSATVTLTLGPEGAKATLTLAATDDSDRAL